MSFVQRILSLYIQHQESMPHADKHINFDDLFRYNHRPLCLYALHYLQDVDLAEDIVQESYAALWEKLQEDIIGKNDDKVFGVSVMLPYPDIKTSEGKSFIGSIEYLPLTIRATYIGGESRVATQYGPISFDHLPDEYTFLKSISEIMITDFEDGELTVRVRCSLTDSKQEVKTDYIHYNYRRNY